MANMHTLHWDSEVGFGLPRRERRSGQCVSYEPDLLEARPIIIDQGLSQRIAEVERHIRALNGPGADALASVARFLLRSEAIASSRIEGVAPAPKQIALAELGTTEEVRGLSDQAKLVANNLTVVQEATSRLVDVEAVTVADLESLHRALLPDQPHLHGIRVRQNWIGGADHHPVDADFVPPPPDRVPELVGDLLMHLSGAAQSPLVQAALVHAQFETIHPFSDGNGRVGRALIHTVLARRGLTSSAVLPISLLLATRRSDYIQGLTAYRYVGAPTSDAAVAGLHAWISTFVDAAGDAAVQSQLIVDELSALQAQWRERLAVHRVRQGLREAPRADSATARILQMLPSAPVLTSTTVRRLLGVSINAAVDALEELMAAGVLSSRSIARGAKAYLADDLLDLATVAERRLASTRFDTRESPPARPVPARPPRRS